MSRYTEGFSKDMIQAFNESKNKIAKFKKWCDDRPNCLTTHEIFMVSRAITRARCSNSAFKTRKTAKLKAHELAINTLQLERKNKKLRIELANLQHKYNSLLEQVKVAFHNKTILKMVSMPISSMNGPEPTTIIDLMDTEMLDDYYLSYAWDNFLE